GYVLSGSVRRAADRLRVSAELAETTRGTVVWASHFDGISEDLFALQDQIASRVVSTIAPQLREAELRRALRKRPESLAASACPAESGPRACSPTTASCRAWPSAISSPSRISPRLAPGWSGRSSSIPGTPRRTPCSRTGTAFG